MTFMGRPRKPGPRTPSGRLRRDKASTAAASHDQDARQQVWQARLRHMGREVSGPVPKQVVQELRLQERGSVLGRLCVDGLISQQQRTAGEDYCLRYLAYAALHGIPPVTARIGRYGEPGGVSTTDREDAAARAKAAYMEDVEILRNAGRGVEEATFTACIRDEPASLSHIKVGLAALVKAGR